MNKINDQQLKSIVEAAIFVSPDPITLDKLKETVLDGFAVSKKQINKVLSELVLDYAPRGVKLVELASGYCFQSDPALGVQLSKLWQENAPKYSRAMLETLALIAYRQPITRGEIEEIRGVTVSSHIIKSLTEREWVTVIGHKEVPGRPALLATTKVFLDYFGLKTLDQLPSADMFAEQLDWPISSQTTIEDEVNSDLQQTVNRSDASSSTENESTHGEQSNNDMLPKTGSLH